MAGATPSLLPKKAAELRIPSGKPGVEGAQALQDLLPPVTRHADADHLLKLDKTGTGFQMVSGAGSG